MGLQKSIDKNRNGLTNAGQRKDALSRIADLEQKLSVAEGRFEVLITQINKVFKDNEENLGNVARVLQAVTSLVGPDNVAAAVQEQRLQEVTDAANHQLAAIDVAVAEGKLTAVSGPCLDDGNLVVTTQRDASGNTLNPYRVIITLGSYSDEAKAAIRGKSVGDCVTMSDGSTVEILAVYAESKPPEATSESSEVSASGDSTTAGA